MNTGFINVIVDEWCEMTNIVLDLKELSFSKIQNLLKETYEILTEYHKEKLIPKEISKLLLEVDSFLYFTSLMEENEKGIDFYPCYAGNRYFVIFAESHRHACAYCNRSSRHFGAGCILRCHQKGIKD